MSIIFVHFIPAGPHAASQYNLPAVVATIISRHNSAIIARNSYNAYCYILRTYSGVHNYCCLFVTAVGFCYIHSLTTVHISRSSIIYFLNIATLYMYIIYTYKCSYCKRRPHTYMFKYFPYIQYVRGECIQQVQKKVLMCPPENFRKNSFGKGLAKMISHILCI